MHVHHVQYCPVVNGITNRLVGRVACDPDAIGLSSIPVRDKLLCDERHISVFGWVVWFG